MTYCPITHFDIASEIVKFSLCVIHTMINCAKVLETDALCHPLSDRVCFCLVFIAQYTKCFKNVGLKQGQSRCFKQHMQSLFMLSNVWFDHDCKHFSELYKSMCLLLEFTVPLSTIVTNNRN